MVCGSAARRWSTTPIRNTVSPLCFRASAATIGIGSGDDGNHSDAAIEDAQHLVVRHVALLLEPLKHGRKRPARTIDARGELVLQHARHVPDETSAGDVREALDRDALHEREDGAHVDARRREKQIGERRASELLGEIDVA